VPSLAGRSVAKPAAKMFSMLKSSSVEGEKPDSLYLHWEATEEHLNANRNEKVKWNVFTEKVTARRRRIGKKYCPNSFRVKRSDTRSGVTHPVKREKASQQTR